MNEKEYALDVIGAWIIVAGTLINASGETINLIDNEEISYKLTGSGNAIEAAGNSLQAAGRSANPENKVSVFGSWLQAAGNSANAVSRLLILNGQLEEGLYIDVIGNTVQTLGATAEAFEASGEKQRIYREQLTAGYLLIAGGAAVDGASGIYFLNRMTQKGKALAWFGGYLQAVGALLAADAITCEGPNE
ncbi:hypothetical protein RFW18_07360 [Metabacillus idriensis]|uniref:DUF6944 family repetitive protein n=1 Tax=Metabacillus idriensis TaxID=324768 RepID=UPI002813FCCE|nr:hypothetical protein [Metabacillus idriensis]MDR0137565.1 hypothetical protein [Metabacillus idriensis]